MPQATLLGYFVPLQPRPSEQSKTVTVETRSTDPPTPVTVAEQLSVHSLVTIEEKKSPSNASVQATTSSGAFHDSDLDVFVPTGQPRAAIVRVQPSHIAKLKTITSTLLPVRYPDRFFNECLDDEMVADLSRVLLWDSQPVGWIRCRLETDDHGFDQIYVQAIGVLAPYRDCGLATCLLEQVSCTDLVQKYGFKSIYCHVWESNEDAIEWYEKRGFTRVVLLEQYYRRLRPAGAWIMRKDFS